MTGPDPDAAAWRAYAAGLGAEAGQLVRDAFAWADRCLETGDGDGGISIVIALSDLEDGRPLRVVLYDLLIAADSGQSGVPGTRHGAAAR